MTKRLMVLLVLFLLAWVSHAWPETRSDRIYREYVEEVTAQKEKCTVTVKGFIFDTTYRVWKVERWRDTYLLQKWDGTKIVVPVEKTIVVCR